MARRRAAAAPAGGLVQSASMARDLVKVVGALLLLALGACGGGCAGRRGTDDGATAAPQAPQPAPAAAPTPVPTPVVPSELACTTDADCVTTAYARPVASPGACYCPTCPAPLAARAAAANEAAWRAQCGAEWEERRGCQAPMCRRPPPVACRAGACVAAP